MKKMITLLLSSAIIAGTVSPYSTALAAATDKSDVMPVKTEAAGVPASNNPTNKALEAAIKAVKAKITIPSGYSQFDYNYTGTNSYSDTAWNLTWRNPENSGYIEVSCDKNNHITYYAKNENSNKTDRIPNYLKSELKEKADEFLKKTEPSVYQKLEFKSSKFDSIYDGTYIYSYQRVENGISFPDNSVDVWVDIVTGEVRRAYLNWLYDTTVPSSAAKLTKDEATDILSDNLKMKLIYRTDSFRIYNDNGSKEQKAFLVYEPDQSYISVDAKTGKVYLSKTEWDDRNGYGADAKESADSTGSLVKGDGGALTPEEIAKVNELEKLITKEKAIEIVTTNKYLYLDKNLVAYSANLNKTYSSNPKDSSYVWYIYLEDNRPEDKKNASDDYRAFANATVDAKTGKILSFSSSLKSEYDDESGKWNTVKIPYDKKEARKLLESFLKGQIKDRFDNSKLVEQTDGYIVYFKDPNTPVYGGYNYQYNRVNDEIEYPYNGINASVDGITGKIYSYYSNWDNNITFESPRGAMSSEEALKKYLSKEGYQLLYEINEVSSLDSSISTADKFRDTNVYNVKPEIRLVYRPDINPSYLSPFTGEQLNTDGTVYKKEQPYSYKDIENTKENREILLLADMNIGFEGENFSPSKEITEKELYDLLEKTGYGYYKEDQNKPSDRLITREEIAYQFIKRLGLEKLAELKGIYSTGYSDEQSINTNYLGAVALAKGLGLITAKVENNFSPKSNVTRAEAVHLILSYINAQNNGTY